MSTEPGYTITVETTANLMRIVAWGFWSQAVLDGYVAEVSGALGQHPLATSKVRVLVDTRAQAVQSQVIAAQMTAFHQKIAPEVGRIAVIVENALQKMQVRRINARGSEGLFDSEAAALAWLLADPRQSRDAA